MKSVINRAVIAALVVGVSGAAWSSDHGRTAREHAAHGSEHGMQVVATRAAPGEPGHGWRYFSDPHTHWAVVISPDGDYYFSRGKGMRQVTGLQPVSQGATLAA